MGRIASAGGGRGALPNQGYSLAGEAFEATVRKDNAGSCSFYTDLSGRSLRTHPHSPALTGTIFSIRGAEWAAKGGTATERGRFPVFDLEFRM